MIAELARLVVAALETEVVVVAGGRACSDFDPDLKMLVATDWAG